jgi:hypothetical protein
MWALPHTPFGKSVNCVSTVLPSWLLHDHKCCMCYCCCFLMTSTHFLFMQVKENISVTAVSLLIVTVATLMFVVSYYVDGVCIQR